MCCPPGATQRQARGAQSPTRVAHTRAEQPSPEGQPRGSAEAAQSSPDFCHTFRWYENRRRAWNA